jgi:hypothetical protein
MEGQTTEAVEREALRTKNQVRPLTETEEGFGLDRVPDGVYGFTCAVGQWDAPLFKKQGFLSYEIHKLADGTALLLGYLTEEDAARLKNSQGLATVHLFAASDERARVFVSLPLHHIRRHKEHSQRTGHGVELHVEPTG